VAAGQHAGPLATQEKGSADHGTLPPEACFAVFPQTPSPALCGYDNGAPQHAGT
jgi:hypothetical protein